MHKTVLVTAALLALSAQAQARPYHHHYRIQHVREAMAMVPGTAMVPSDERVVGRRPAGCPNAFCGCEASLYRFGRIIPELNLASNWRRFPRAAPAPGMAAVRSGHVMILQAPVAGNVWTVHDGNSGGHATREHARSLAGYTIVDPSGATGTFAFSGQSQASGFASGYSQPQSPYASRGRRLARNFNSQPQASSFGGGYGQPSYAYARGRTIERSFGGQQQASTFGG